MKGVVDVHMLHPSLSRKHFCVLIDKESGALLIDLGSKAGT